MAVILSFVIIWIINIVTACMGRCMVPRAPVVILHGPVKLSVVVATMLFRVSLAESPILSVIIR